MHKRACRRVNRARRMAGFPCEAKLSRAILEQFMNMA
jgi:hypothetical protein